MNQISNRTETDLLAAEFERSKIVVFAGAGISIASPTNLPIWSAFRDLFLTQLKDRVDSPIKNKISLKGNILQIKPESLLQVILDCIGEHCLTSLLSSLKGDAPNTNHLSLGLLCKYRKIRCIFTTNFDCMLERALERFGYEPLLFPAKDNTILQDPNKYLVIATEEEFGHPDLSNVLLLNDGPVMIFKLHGTLGKLPNEGRGLIATLHNAAKPLSTNKHKLLEFAWKSNPFLFIGYSGNDDDIFPFLVSHAHQASNVFWNFRPGTNVSHNIRPIQLLRRLGSIGKQVSYSLLHSQEGSENLLHKIIKCLNISAGELSEDLILNNTELGLRQKAVQEINGSMYWERTVISWCMQIAKLDVLEIWSGFFTHVGAHSQALEILKTACKIGSSDNRRRARLYLKTGRACLPGAPEASPFINIKDGEPYLTKATEEAIGCNDTEFASESELLNGILMSLKGKFELAKSCFNRSRKILKQTRDGRLMGIWHLNYAFMCGNCWNPRKYQYHLRKAIHLSEETGDLALRHRAHSFLADAILNQYDIDPDGRANKTRKKNPLPDNVSYEVEKIYRKCAEICHDIGDLRGLTKVQNSLQVLYEFLGRDEDAVNIAIQRAESLLQIGSTHEQADSLILTAGFYIEEGNLQRAEKDLAIAEKMYYESENVARESSFGAIAFIMTSLASSLKNEACWYANRQKFDAAAYLLVMAKDYYKKAKKIGDVAEIDNLLERIPPESTMLIKIHRPLTKDEVGMIKDAFAGKVYIVGSGIVVTSRNSLTWARVTTFLGKKLGIRSYDATNLTYENNPQTNKVKSDKHN